ncbi:PaaI family thioesterase [Alicyclobacillus tolerans]|uniref:PaaI family thioesterase n=1 Tax=Alicyclobacillus tolerans TaxID=90970 RepID=UPI001F26D975|nr:PaaI family thioesterase [Alicyclobacillus tolerans]MCF8567288.1 PaaI family thioesterase [Alicyclobacillus tolerans]
MVRDEIVKELEGLPDSELESILRLIRAKKDTYHRPLAFVQELMGFTQTDRQEDVFRYEMRVTDDLVNRYGLLHGGLMTAFIDTAMAETAFLLDQSIERALTLNIAVDFIRPGQPGDVLHAEIRVVQNSRVMIVFQSTVTNPKGETVATAMAHFYKQYKHQGSK